MDNEINELEKGQDDGWMDWGANERRDWRGAMHKEWGFEYFMTS